MSHQRLALKPYVQGWCISTAPSTTSGVRLQNYKYFLKQTKQNGKNIEIFPFYMNFGEFRKDTPHTHLHLAKPHGCWAEASGVCMSTSHLDLTSTLEVYPKSWTQIKMSSRPTWRDLGYEWGSGWVQVGCRCLYPTCSIPVFMRDSKELVGYSLWLCFKYLLAVLQVPFSSASSTL